jgi:hypothetical protein
MSIGEQTKTLTQVLEFIAKLDQNSLNKVREELNSAIKDLPPITLETQTNRESLKEHEDLFKGVFETQKKQAREAELEILRFAKECQDKGKSEYGDYLDHLKRGLKDQTKEALDLNDKLLESNRQRYAKELWAATEAFTQRRTLSKEEFEILKDYEKNEAAILEKRRDILEGKFGGGFESGVHGEAKKGEESTAGDILAKGVRQIGAEFKGNSTGENTAKALSSAAAGLLESKSLGQAALATLQGIFKVGMLTYELNLKMTQEGYAAGRGTPMFGAMAEPGGKAVFDRVKENIRSARLDLRTTESEQEEMPGVFNVLQRQRPGGFTGMAGATDTSNKKQVDDTLYELKVAADLLGVKLTEVAELAGKQSRYQGTSVDEMARTLQRLTLVGRDIMKDTGKEIDIANFVKNAVTVEDTLRKFGRDIDYTTGFVSKFAVELDRGLIAVDTLIQWATGMTSTNAGARAYLAQELMKDKNEEYEGLRKALAKSGSADPVSLQRTMLELSEGNTKTIEKLGLSTKEATIIQSKAAEFMMNKIVELGKSQSGGDAALARQLRDMIATEVFGMSLPKTTEQRDILFERGVGGGGKAVMDKSVNPELDRRRTAESEVIMALRETLPSIMNKMGRDLEKIEINTRKEVKKIAGSIASGIVEGGVKFVPAPAPASGTIVSGPEMAAQIAEGAAAGVARGIEAASKRPKDHSREHRGAVTRIMQDPQG